MNVDAARAGGAQADDYVKRRESSRLGYVIWGWRVMVVVVVLILPAPGEPLVRQSGRLDLVFRSAPGLETDVTEEDNGADQQHKEAKRNQRRRSGMAKSQEVVRSTRPVSSS